MEIIITVYKAIMFCLMWFLGVSSMFSLMVHVYIKDKSKKIEYGIKFEYYFKAFLLTALMNLILQLV